MNKKKKKHTACYTFCIFAEINILCARAHYNYIILCELASVCRRRAVAEKHNFMRVIDKNDENEDASARRKKHAGKLLHALAHATISHRTYRSSRLGDPHGRAAQSSRRHAPAPAPYQQFLMAWSILFSASASRSEIYREKTKCALHIRP